MAQTKSKGKARQLELMGQGQRLPCWETLPEECRRGVVELLEKLLRNEVVANQEKADE